jgi:hypothetical protein
MTFRLRFRVVETGGSCHGAGNLGEAALRQPYNRDFH